MPDHLLNEDGTVVDLDTPPPAAPHVHDPAAIANCTRCDADGYLGRVVCDHRERTPGPGRAAVQAELDRIRHRKVERAKQPYRTEQPATEEGTAE